MLIEVETLSDKPQPFAHAYQPEEVSLDEEQARLASEVKVSGSARRKREEVRLQGNIKADVEILCDRCLAASQMPLEVEFDMGFIPQEVEAVKAENVELQAEDLVIAAYEGEAVDLDEVVREQILLALPSRHLCSEDCKGLCQECGANLNAGQCTCEQADVDPRWSALAGWKEKSSDK